MQNKKPSRRGVWIFSGTAHFENLFMPFICVRCKIAENWEKSMRHETIGCFCHSVRCEGVPGVGVLVPLFPSKIGMCSLVPTFISHLFPAFLICSSLYPSPPPLGESARFCFEISHSN